MSGSPFERTFSAMDLEATACPLCGSEASRLLYDFSPFQVLRCEACGLGYLSPRLKRAAAAHLYRDGYFVREDSERRGYAAYPALAPLIQKTVRRRYSWIRPLVSGGSVLDVGCAYGYALDTLREDFDRCSGVDLSPEAIAEVKRKGYEGHCGELFSAPWEAESFDLALCFDTIEHVSEPAPFMKKIAQLLRPGGVAAIATPNLDGRLSRWSGKRWVSLKIPEHILYFTPAAMKRLLEGAGLALESFRPDFQDSPLSLVLDRLGRALPWGGAVLCALARLEWLSRVSVTVPNGMFFVLARKTG